MNQFIKKLLRTILHRKKRYITKMTDKDELQILLNKLKPVSSGKKLIRLGAEGDGGYLVPDDLKEIKSCFSPGVGYISQFERDCAHRGMNVFLADKSVEKPTEENMYFQFTKKYIGVTTNNDFMTLDDWVEFSVPKSQNELLLQIDIEGYEYEVFLGMSDQLLKRFRIIVVEFHHLDQLWNKPFFGLASRVFEKLLQTHSCVHNHPNNYAALVKVGDIEIPEVMELTFLRHDRVTDPSFIDTFPHELDEPNNSEKPPLDLPKCWYD